MTGIKRVMWPFAYFMLGIFLVSIGVVLGSSITYKVIESTHYKYGGFLLLSGGAEIADGNYLQALMELHDAETRIPYNPVVSFFLAWVYAELDSKDIAKFYYEDYEERKQGIRTNLDYDKEIFDANCVSEAEEKELKSRLVHAGIIE